VGEEHGLAGCHQLGRLDCTLPPSLGKFNTSHDAWLRISSGQAGGNMSRSQWAPWAACR
jgi:hypothetical protein